MREDRINLRISKVALVSQGVTQQKSRKRGGWETTSDLMTLAFALSKMGL